MKNLLKTGFVYALLISSVTLFGAGNYVDYSESAFENASDTNRVLFFHANWCPTCKKIDKQLNTASLNEGITVFKVDYDKENSLKQKYGISKQHTFVLVDVDGNEIKKWSGGGADEINSNVQ
jgi:thioredoxin 1